VAQAIPGAKEAREAALNYPIVRDLNGELITPNMLPSMGMRWTPRRREIAALALRSGLITIDQARARWCMTIDELREWGLARNKRVRSIAADFPVRPPSFSGSIEMGGVRVVLNSTDFLILRLLVARKGKVVTQSMMGRLLYGSKTDVKSRIIDVFILRLRRRLQTSGVAVRIETVWGRGYLLREPEHRGTSAAASLTCLPKPQLGALRPKERIS
jgi:DNA-binding winged helix-turn-helix (wHTH) protein